MRKYNFKVNQVMNEIEHSIRRFMDETMPGYDLCVDLTSDPRSLVAAMFLNRCFDERAHVVYVEDLKHDNVSFDVKNLVLSTFKDRFHMIEADDCTTYTECLEHFVYEEPMRQLRANRALKYLFESSKFSNFIFCEPVDHMQSAMGYWFTSGKEHIAIFDSLVWTEIREIGEMLKLDEKMLDDLYEKSQLIQEHEQIIGQSIWKYGKIFREYGTFDEKAQEIIRKYGKIIIDTSIHVVRVMATSIYDLNL